MNLQIANPYRPGAGHMPPFLAGRQDQVAEFSELLDQDPVLQNVILTGLRGVGKSVFLESLKPLAASKGWLWVGTDLSESVSVSEDRLAVRLITDLAVATAGVVVAETERAGFAGSRQADQIALDYDTLVALYHRAPGLTSDKLRTVLETVWQQLDRRAARGVVFAYDESQNMTDHAEKEEFPLSLLLEVFQSLQRRGVRYLLVLSGLPTLLQKLVEARTYAERMFHQIFLAPLDEKASEEAIREPTRRDDSPLKFSAEAASWIFRTTRGYPYFIQYFCRQAFDIWLQQILSGQEVKSIPMAEITRKLDGDFYAGRWGLATDRQRELLQIIASLSTAASEFTVQEIVQQSGSAGSRPFSPSHVNQMLATLSNSGFVYRNRYGKYSFAIPLLNEFIKRQATAA